MQDTGALGKRGERWTVDSNQKNWYDKRIEERKEKAERKKEADKIKRQMDKMILAMDYEMYASNNPELAEKLKVYKELIGEK